MFLFLILLPSLIFQYIHFFFSTIFVSFFLPYFFFLALFYFNQLFLFFSSFFLSFFLSFFFRLFSFFLFLTISSFIFLRVFLSFLFFSFRFVSFLSFFVSLFFFRYAFSFFPSFKSSYTVFVPQWSWRPGFNPRSSHTKDFFKKWYLIPPCLTLRIIRYVSRVKRSNPEKGVAPSSTPWCSSYWKGNLWLALDYSFQHFTISTMSFFLG